ncbi:MAG: ankyrin repeat domain-containing protein [Planctomycetota bacterium]|jgi:hypothetical protein
MKISLPLKLGIFVVLLFTAVIAACLLWMPVKVMYYGSELSSQNPAEQAKGLEKLFILKERGMSELSRRLSGGRKEAEFLKEQWCYRNDRIPADQYRSTAMHLAAAEGFTDSLVLMLNNGAYVNFRDNDSWTPLHWAALRGNSEMASMLIEKGADVNAQTNDGRTPLNYATENGRNGTAAVIRTGGGKMRHKLRQAAK